MEDNYSNEFVGVDSASVIKCDGEPDNNSVQMMQEFVSTVLSLSQHIAENNAAKYRAQAEIIITDIQAKMQEELQDINGYYNTREKQEEHFNTIIMGYQEQFKVLTNQLLSEENETRISNLKWAIERLEHGVGEQLDKLANNIINEQNIRLETSKTRKKRLLGFLKRE